MLLAHSANSLELVGCRGVDSQSTWLDNNSKALNFRLHGRGLRFLEIRAALLWPTGPIPHDHPQGGPQWSQFEVQLVRFDDKP